MSLNPITAIEKLINEHGSAAILRDRLLLASEQFSALECKTTELTLKTGQLEAENKTLRAQLQQRAAQIHALEVAAEQKRTGNRTEIEQHILTLLASSDGPVVQRVAQQLGIGVQVAMFHLSELSTAELIYPQNYINRESEWHLANEGRRYLIQRGLIQ